MAQQTPGCDLPCPTVGQRELRQPFGDRSIQIEHRFSGVPSGRQRHDRGRDEGLGHRRQVEHRLGCDRRTGADVTDAEPTRDDLLLAHHRNGQACHVVGAEKGLDQRPQAFFYAPSKASRTDVHVPTLRRQRVAASAHASHKECPAQRSTQRVTLRELTRRKDALSAREPIDPDEL